MINFKIMKDISSQKRENHMPRLEISRLHSNLKIADQKTTWDVFSESLSYFSETKEEHSGSVKPWIRKICNLDCVKTPLNWRKALLK